MPTFLEAFEAIRTASTPTAIVEIVQRYLAGLPPDEAGQLPFGLRPELLLGPSHMAMWALQIRKGEADAATAGAAYGRVAKLLTEATARMRELSERA